MVGSDPHDDEAVSPVIGVLLMVAITVILAAVIGTFVMEIGNNPQRNIQAGVNIDPDADSDEVKVTYTTNQNANHTEVRAVNESGGAGTVGLGEIGDEAVFTETGAELRGSAWNVSGDAPSGGYPGHSANTEVDVTVRAVNGQQASILNSKSIQL